jgi:nitroreductase
MLFNDVIRQRRSIRKYKSQAIEKDKIDLLVEMVLRAPSSRGFNPWQFVVVTDNALLEALSQAKPHGARFLEAAPLGIVVCADPEISDVWIEDTSIAAIYLHLAATALGLGSCWIQIRQRMHAGPQTAEAYIREVLSIPSSLVVAAMLAIGYPDETKAPHPQPSLQYDKVHYNRYGTHG